MSICFESSNDCMPYRAKMCAKFIIWFGWKAESFAEPRSIARSSPIEAGASNTWFGLSCGIRTRSTRRHGKSWLGVGGAICPGGTRRVAGEIRERGEAPRIGESSRDEHSASSICRLIGEVRENSTPPRNRRTRQKRKAPLTNTPQLN